MIRRTLAATLILGLFHPTVGYAGGWRAAPVPPHKIIPHQGMLCRSNWFCGYVVIPPDDDYAAATEHDLPREHDVPTERDFR
jgi:hypothetical protein